MTIIDFLLIAAVVAAALYTVYRLFVGWLRTTFLEIETEEQREAKHSSNESLQRNRSNDSHALNRMLL